MIEQSNLDTLSGLSQTEVAHCLTQEGYNELPSTQNRSVLKIVLEIVREPIFLLLVGCGTIYLLLGEAQEASILLGFIFLIVGIGTGSAKWDFPAVTLARKRIQPF
jgi:P-type Ca2+ transporter type 2C